MRRILVLAAVSFTGLFSQAQSKSATGYDYTTALGVKVWDGGGISLKHFFNERNAGELIGYFWS